MYKDMTKTSDTVNTLGVIPIVHNANSRFGDMAFGTSALADVIDPVRNYNETLAQLSKIRPLSFDPTTFIRKSVFKRWSAAPNRVWSNIPIEGRVEKP